MSVRPTGYFENKNLKDVVQFWGNDEWDPKSYTKDSVREHFRSNGWEVPIFMTSEQAFESRSYRYDEPTGGHGWYTEPGEPLKARYWDGSWGQMPYHKSQIIANHQDNQLPAPVFDPETAETATVVSVEPQNWAVVNEEYTLWQYGNRSAWSEYFDGNAITKEFIVPRFYQNGGTPKSFDVSGPAFSKADSELIKLIVSRITLEEVRATLGDSASEFNSGPRWIKAKDNERLARWWDGNDFTGDVELIGVLQQREHDAEAGGELQTVSHAPVTLETEAGSWYVNPDDPATMIRWGGTRWDRLKTVQEMIAELFGQLNESIPEEWSRPSVLTSRHEDLMGQLKARLNGEADWYKEPGRFDDLFMRYWNGQAWTEHTSQQIPGWYSDPWDESLLRYWNGAQWSDKTRTKEAEQRRAERNASNAELAKNVGVYLGLKAAESVVWQFSKERKNQRVAADRADYSRQLRDTAAQEQAKFYRDRQKRGIF
jgi:hypothetical protein